MLGKRVLTNRKANHMRWYPRLVASIGLFVAVTWISDICAQEDKLCFNETPFCIAGRFREFWEKNGGLATFGLPIAEQREEIVEGKPYQTQWLERTRLELHPENQPPYDILLGRLGADVLERQGSDWFQFPKSEAKAECHFFSETGHNVCGSIWQAWRAGGLEFDGRQGVSFEESLALFGLPLSDEISAKIEGKEYTIQWFERTRFELHPENKPPYDVLLGRLGSEYLASRSSTPTLPQNRLDEIREAALKAGLVDEPLAPERVLIYSLPPDSTPDQDPNQGIAMLLTPRKDFLKDLNTGQNLKTEAVTQCDPQITERILGGLSVVQQINGLPIGNFAMSLEPGCQRIVLHGGGGSIFLPAVLRRIDLKDNPPLALINRLGELRASTARAQPPAAPAPKQFSQPTGLISARLLCEFPVAEPDALGRICASLDTPAQSTISDLIAEAAQQFGVSVDSSLAVPDTDGSKARERCANELANGSPPYPKCTPSLLLAALQSIGGFTKEDDAQVRPIGIIFALEPFPDQVFSDVGLASPAVPLPPGPYLAHDVRLPSDPEVAPRVTLARVRLNRPSGAVPPGQPSAFFIQSYNNFPLLPLNEPPLQAAIVGGYLPGCCLLECWPAYF
jgi:hypothetical protein